MKKNYTNPVAHKITFDYEAVTAATSSNHDRSIPGEGSCTRTHTDNDNHVCGTRTLTDWLKLY